MTNRSLNKVQLIGNLTRDPELRYTPQGTAVCTMGLATNRSWVTETNEKKEDVEFHRLVAWNKLAEICAQLLFIGRRVYFEGRLQTREWTGKDGVKRQTTEVVVSDMIILDSKRSPGEVDDADISVQGGSPTDDDDLTGEDGFDDQKKGEAKETSSTTKAKKTDDARKTDQIEDKDKGEEKSKPQNPKAAESGDVGPDDIPF